jgi:hypothetical protein
MYFSPSLERIYAPYVAGWWFGMMVCLHWWAGLQGPAVETPVPRKHLRLVTDRGRLVEHP